MKGTREYSDQGFTLVEIMVVVFIISLLAAMAIPAFTKVRASARQKAITNNLRQISSAAQQYMLEQGVSQVGETQLAGTTTSAFIRPIPTVIGEAYSGLTINTNTTQISVLENDGDATRITFNL
jgi:type IV pilus assembly protein PilA